MSYLVMIECSWDDIPVRMFGNRADAMAFAKTLKPDDADKYGSYLRRGDLTEPLGVSIVRFTPGGRAAKHFGVMTWEDVDA